jgi:hypothetical protein
MRSRLVPLLATALLTAGCAAPRDVTLDPGNGMQKSPLAARLSTTLQSTPPAP